MDCFYYKVAVTPEERAAAQREWDVQRARAAAIRDEYDLVVESRFSSPWKASPPPSPPPLSSLPQKSSCTLRAWRRLAWWWWSPQ